MKTIEGNKLIAEFMGVKPVDGFYNGWELHKAGLPFSCGAMGNGTSDPKFHSSWDWLMPVVEKIEGLNDGGFSVHINKFQVYIDEAIDKGITAKMVVRNSCDDGKLEAVYKVITEFIQWYNNQNENS